MDVACMWLPCRAARSLAKLNRVSAMWRFYSFIYFAPYQSHRMPPVHVSTSFLFSYFYFIQVMYGSIFTAAAQPADYYSPTCGGASIFALSAASALLMQVMHMCLSITMFDAWRRVKIAWPRVAIGVAIHLCATLSTYMNFVVSCAVGTPLLAVVVGAAVVFAWRTIKAPEYAVYAMPAIKAATPAVARLN
jgi:hypothetical protein